MKSYVKPELYYESFELTEHIAGGCNAHVNSSDANSCKGEIEMPGMGGVMAAFGSAEACGDDLNEDYCYTASVGVVIIANS